MACPTARAGFAATVAATAGLAAAPGAAQDFPAETVELVVPFGAGGNTDLIARAFQPAFAEALGTEVIVRNIDGAAGTIGAAEVSQADPDGYTVGYLPIGPVAIQPHLRELPYDAESFTPVCLISDNPVLFLVSENSEFQSMEDVEAAVGEGRTLAYGSSGPGTIPHVAMFAAADALGADWRHVPSTGTGDAMRSLAGGFIQFFADTPSVLAAYDVRPIAVYAEERLDELPDVPTMAEIGHDLQFSVWQGLFVPRDTPEDVIAALAKACGAAVEDADFVAAMENLQSRIDYRAAEETRSFVQEHSAQAADILSQADLGE